MISPPRECWAGPSPRKENVAEGRMRPLRRQPKHLRQLRLSYCAYRIVCLDRPYYTRRLRPVRRAITMPCSGCQGGANVFGEGEARSQIKRYRRKGPSKNTRILLDALRREGIEGLTLLDIGGGIRRNLDGAAQIWRHYRHRDRRLTSVYHHGEVRSGARGRERPLRLPARRFRGAGEGHPSSGRRDARPRDLLLSRHARVGRRIGRQGRPALWGGVSA